MRVVQLQAIGTGASENICCASFMPICLTHKHTTHTVTCRYLKHFNMYIHVVLCSTKTPHNKHSKFKHFALFTSCVVCKISLLHVKFNHDRLNRALKHSIYSAQVPHSCVCKWSQSSGLSRSTAVVRHWSDVCD